jgi:hypothetical protein
MRSLAKLLKLLVLGLAADVAIIETLGIVLLIWSVFYYDGRCFTFFEMSKPCSFLQFVLQTGGFLLVGVIISGWWPYALGAALVPPIFALMIGYSIRQPDLGRA